MGKNKLARWAELGSYPNVIQPVIGEVAGKDHPIKGKWRTGMFGNNNPVILELGCGKGEYTVGLAERFPGNNYIGVDIKGARMWRGARTSNERKLPNAGFLRTRIEFIDSFFAEDEVDEIWITFPDPHPGAGNSGRRLTSPGFLNKYRTFLRNNGLIHLKTDNSELFRYTRNIALRNNLEIISSTDNLYEVMTDNITHPDNSPGNNSALNKNISSDILIIKTHYEGIFLEKGLKINYLSFRLEKEKNIEEAFTRPGRGQ